MTSPPKVSSPPKVPLAWGLLVSPDFRSGVYNICHEYEWTNAHASWLMSCMAFETGKTFAPNIRNRAGSGAVGLIQFMPATAKGLGTSTEHLLMMLPEEQLHFVGKHFKPWAKRIKTLSDMYMAILLPKFVGQPDEAVLFSGGIAYRQNSGLDSNKDGLVTKGEATAKVAACLVEGLRKGHASS